MNLLNIMFSGFVFGYDPTLPSKIVAIEFNNELVTLLFQKRAELSNAHKKSAHLLQGKNTTNTKTSRIPTRTLAAGLSI